MRSTSQTFEYCGVSGKLLVNECGDFGEFGEMNFNSEAPEEESWLSIRCRSV